MTIHYNKSSPDYTSTPTQTKNAFGITPNAFFIRKNECNQPKWPSQADVMTAKSILAIPSKTLRGNSDSLIFELSVGYHLKSRKVPKDAG